MAVGMKGLVEWFKGILLLIAVLFVLAMLAWGAMAGFDALGVNDAPKPHQGSSDRSGQAGQSSPDPGQPDPAGPDYEPPPTRY
jgi:hypothetical protein